MTAREALTAYEDHPREPQLLALLIAIVEQSEAHDVLIGACVDASTLAAVVATRHATPTDRPPAATLLGSIELTKRQGVKP